VIVMTKEMTPEELRKLARQERDKREESFQRCDTDGFLSQWAYGLTAQEYDRQADINEAGGKAEFEGLFRRSDGKRVRAKLKEGQYGHYWMFCDMNDKPTGRFLPDSKGGPRSKMFKEGFEKRMEWAPAEARCVGRGTGLSGTAWITTVRTDDGYPEDAEAF
jgi:hypothetical protein